MGLLHSKEDAEEITQDVFVKVYQSISAYNGKSAFPPGFTGSLLIPALIFKEKETQQILDRPFSIAPGSRKRQAGGNTDG